MIPLYKKYINTIAVQKGIIQYTCSNYLLKKIGKHSLSFQVRDNVILVGNSNQHINNYLLFNKQTIIHHIQVKILEQFGLSIIIKDIKIVG